MSEKENKKYFVVAIANQTTKEITNAISPYVSNELYYSSGPYVAYIKEVKHDTRKKYDKFLMFNYSYNESYWASLEWICELKTTSKGEEYFVDPVTGESYWSSEKMGTNPSKRPVLKSIRAVTASELAKRLKEMTEDEISLYQDRIQKLNKNMEKGYIAYLRRITAENTKRQSDEDFISDFKNRHKKK